MGEKYTVVIPTLNEEGNIGRLVSTLKLQDPDCLVLVPDGGSTDKTEQEVLDAGGTFIFGGGVSESIARGIQYSVTDKIIVMDADGAHDFSIVPKMAKALSIHDMVYGWREISRDSCINRLISWMGKVFTLFLALGVKDRMTGFFGGRRHLLEKVEIKRGPKPFLEYLLRSSPTSVFGLPYTFKPRYVGKSKLGRGKILGTGIKQLLRLYLYKYAQAVRYVIVGGTGFGLFLGLEAFFSGILSLGHYSGLLLAGSLTFFYNFTLHKLWTFAVVNGLSIRSLPNILWNLGHKNEDGDFDWWEWNSGWPHKRFKRTLGKYIKELAGDGRDVLSLGCGSSPILNMFEGRKIGIDINKRKLDFFSRHTNAILIEGDISKMIPLRMKGERFDVVLCNEVVEHLDDAGLRNVVEICKSNLKEGGRFILSTPDISNKLGWIVESFLHGEFHIGMKGSKELVDIVEGMGFNLVDQRSYLWDKIYLFMKPVREPVRGVEEGAFSYA